MSVCRQSMAPSHGSNIHQARHLYTTGLAGSIPRTTFRCLFLDPSSGCRSRCLHSVRGSADADQVLGRYHTSEVDASFWVLLGDFLQCWPGIALPFLMSTSLFSHPIKHPLDQNFIAQPVSVDHTAYSWHRPMGTHIQYHSLQAYASPKQ